MDDNKLTSITDWDALAVSTLPESDWESRERRERLITLLAPMAGAAGATTVENIINTACKLERYITTGINPMEPMVADHSHLDGPINSDVFVADLGEKIVIDEQGILQFA